MYAYPTELPKAEIQDVISTIMQRNFTQNAAHFAKDVWVLAGYALSQTVGELPQAFGSMSSSGLTSLTNDEAIAVLQQVVEASDQPGAVQALNIPWKQVLSWALQLLSQLTAG